MMRYNAPESNKLYPKVLASRHDTVPLPEPLGPSMAMTGKREVICVVLMEGADKL